LPLDGFFAQPGDANLHRLYQAGQATSCTGRNPYRERSHFDGQDVLESGLPTRAGRYRLAQPRAPAIEPGGRIDMRGRRPLRSGR
jgi:uncharacterized protein (DUF1501 family)